MPEHYDDVERERPPDTSESLLREFIDLCAVGDVDEDTEALGWGDLIVRAKRHIGRVAP